MKQVSAIFRVTIASLATHLFTGCSSIDAPQIVVTSQVLLKENSKVIALPANDPLIAEIQHWIQSHHPRWQRSFITYAPKLVVKSSTFNLNFFDGTAVLNFQPDQSKPKWIQLERSYSLEELDFLKEVQSRL